MKDIAVCVIGYNRLSSLQRCLSALDAAYFDAPVHLYISIDKSDTDEVERYAQTYPWRHGSKEVILHTERQGLRRHVLQCGDLSARHDALIVLEDDIFVAPSFYLYAQACVEAFADSDEIAGISLYTYQKNWNKDLLPIMPLHSASDIYLMQIASSWGQVWMKRQWQEFRHWYDAQGEQFADAPYLPEALTRWNASSWLKYHTRYLIETNKYFVFPYHSLSTCFGDAGEHTRQATTVHQTNMLYGRKDDYVLNPIVRYDAFHESELIYDHLGLSKDELCIDFYGVKGNRMKRRYWLSAEALPYRVVRSFGVVMKPYERNVLLDYPGEGLFLYDTSVKAAKPSSHTCTFQYKQMYLYNHPLDWWSITKGYLLRLRNVLNHIFHP